jgi:DNA-directed RNA polymerase specialized sigma24 family protein
VQDTCERALRFRHLFREGTSLRGWVLTIMRHRFLDTAKKTKDAMVSGKRVPLEELSEAAYSDARAEQICFVKEALGLAGRATIGGVSQRFLAHLGWRDPGGVCGF